MLYVTILIFMILAAISAAMALFSSRQQKTLRNTLDSSAAYLAAEAGIEDALMRLTKEMDWVSPYTFTFDGAKVTVSISELVGGARTIVAEGEFNSSIQKIRAIYQLDVTEQQFYYGAQVGDGGVVMRNGSKIFGNLFSNGSAIGTGTITDSVIVARNGNKIEGLKIGANARVHSCKNSTIGGKLTYVSGGSIQNCTAGELVDGGPSEIQPQDFPISQATINDWKSDAEAGGVIVGDVIINSDTSLGPVKIEGNLLVTGAKLTMTGTIWVTGNFDTGTNAKIKLDPSYGDLSGVLIVDGNVKIRNNAELKGSGAPSSYLLIISTSASLDKNNPAIDVKNNALGSILFAPNGLMVIHNNVKLTEAMAYKLLLQNNAEVRYEIGLRNVNFSSGPSAGWKVTRWKEIE